MPERCSVQCGKPRNLSGSEKSVALGSAIGVLGFGLVDGVSRETFGGDDPARSFPMRFRVMPIDFRG